MIMKIHDDKKYVSIWLTRTEARDDSVREGLQSIYSEYKTRKYRVVVFESGDENLASLTKDLLYYNLHLSERAAETSAKS